MFMRRLLFSAALFAILAQAVNAREWTDATGRFKTEAELVKVEAGKVFLKKQSDGATIQVPIAKLSQADQAYLKTLESPAPELTAAGQSAFPLKTAGCVGLMVLNPKPVFEHEGLNNPAIKPLIEQGVAAAGIDFRKAERAVVFFLKPELMGPATSSSEPGVIVVEFAEAVDPAPMLEKIPTDYEQITVAGKPCSKPAEENFPWVCTLDEKTLAFAGDEKSLASALTATSDDAELAKLLDATGEEDEVRYVLNLVPMKDTIAQARAAMPPAAMAGSEKIFDMIEKIHSMRFTVDLDGTPSIELVLQAADEAAVATMETEIKAGLAKLPELMEAGMKAAAAQAPEGEGPAMNPAMMMGPMLANVDQQIDEKLSFEPQGSTLKISVKFPSDTPPLIDSIVQMAGFLAMMSQQQGGSPFGSPQ